MFSTKILLVCIMVIFLTIYINLYTIESFNLNDCNIEDIWCINLKKSKDRWEKIKTHNLNINRFNAVDGYKLNISDYENNGTCLEGVYDIHSEHAGLGALGCSLSHLTLWEHVKNNNKNTLIIEDDVIIPENLLEKYNNYISEIPNNWDIIFFGGNKIIGKKISDKIVSPINDLEYILNKYNIKNFNYGSFAYMVNKKSFTKLLKLSKPLQYTIDKHLRDIIFNNLNVYYLSPILINHDYGQKSIIRNKYRISDNYQNRIICDIKNHINIDDYFEDINMLYKIESNCNSFANKLGIKYFKKILKNGNNYHLDILKAFSETSKTSCLIIDSNCLWDKRVKLNKIIKDIPLDYDIIFFGKKWEKMNLTNSKINILQTNSLKGLHSYAITKKCVKKILSHISEEEITDYDIYSQITNNILEDIINKLIYSDIITAYYTNPSIFYID